MTWQTFILTGGLGYTLIFGGGGMVIGFYLWLDRRRK
jgi:hypothetical protein